ncbi:MAG: hypothetical protein R2730_08580 [Chitinophagales bacterium]
MTDLITTYDKTAWDRLRIKLKHQFKRRPDLQGILFLIGHRELGQFRSEFTKEEKQDVLHIAVCTLLSRVGFYSFIGRDEDGWPHFELTRNHRKLSGEEQEKLLKRLVLEYFDEL